MKTITANQVKKLPAGSTVWLAKRDRSKRSEFTVIQYGKEKRIKSNKSRDDSRPRPIKDYQAFVYEVEA